MRPALLFAALAGAAAFQPAFAQTEAAAPAACVRPQPPAAVDGATVSKEQMLEAKNQATAFMTASDAYQSCVLAEVGQQRAAAKAAKAKFDPAIAKAADAKVKANQDDKVAVGAAFNAAAKAYREAHPQ